MARIVVEIAANAGQAIGETTKFEKSLGVLYAQLERLQRLQPFQNSVESLKRGQAAIQATQGRINELNKTLSGGGKSLTVGSNQAAFALNNLGRVAQDAPFGFIGIQNNLNPLLESFQQLKATTGTTGSAIKAMTASLIGPAGLGLALSAVSAALLFYNQYQQRAAKDTEETTQSIEEQRAEFIKTPYEKAVIDLTELTQKISLAKQGFLDKKAVLKEYNEGIGATIGKVTDLDAAEQKLVQNGDKYLQLMFLKAKAEFAFKKAAEESYNLALKQNEIDAKRPQISKDFNINADRTNKVIEQQAFNMRELLQASQQVTPALDGVATKFEKVNKNLGEQIADENALNELTKSSQKAVEVVTSAQQAVLDFAKKNGFDLGGIFGVTPEAINEVRINLLKGREAFTDFFGNTEMAYKSFAKTVKGLDSIFGSKTSQNDLLLSFQSTNTELTTFADNYNKTAEQIRKTPLIPVEQFQINSEKILTEAQKFTNALNEVLFKGIEAGAFDFGMAIGTALANGENLINAATGSILSSIGDIIIQFGKLTIAAGIASTALGKALQNPLSPGNGLAAVAAGIALVAVGAAVRGFGANVGKGTSDSFSSKAPQNRYRPPGFAGGVTNFEGGLAYVHAGELLTNLPTGANVIPRAKTDRLLSGLTGGANVVIVEGVVKGQNIVLSTNRTRRYNSEI